MVSSSRDSTTSLQLLFCVLFIQQLLCTVTYGLNTNLECPQSWVSHGKSCYKFVRSTTSHFSNATAYCDSFNSRLLSVNDFEENNFLLDWLQDNDPYKRVWLTSALVSYGQNNWQWTGDSSKFINNNELWLQTNSSYERQLMASSFTGAAYTFSPSANKWGLIRVDSNKPVYSFICEFSLANTKFGNKYLEREIDYGFNIHNKSLIPRGPKIVLEPKDVVFDISGRSHSNQLKLRCVADGYPEPTYTWYREDHGASSYSQPDQSIDASSTTYLGSSVAQSDGIASKAIDPLEDDRITQTDGTLTIFNPNQQSDKGKYYCAASNQFGRVISQTVSITFGYILEFSKKRSIERGKENWGKSISCDAPQHHPRVLFYWTKAEFPNFVQEDKRVFISHDGNLYFSSLEKIDRSSYSCQIQSLISSTGRFGPSFPLVVDPASNGQKLQFANGFPKSFPEGPLDGQDIRLECMAYGYPTPSYNWSRVSPTSELPRGHQLRNDGKVLLLPRARIEDAGEYICKVSSESESLQKSVRVSIQAAPRFTQPLADQILGEREQLVWECEAFGLPKVSYNWFKNGQELSMNNLSPLDVGRYAIRENRLSIDSVQRERDSGMYQCRASNQHGSALSSAQLRVGNLRPQADKDPMPLSVQAMLEQNVTLPCYVEAIPRPLISWRKEGQQIDELRQRIRVTPNGLLHITRVRASDAGGYECTAENGLGSLTSRTWLIVRPAPLIVDPLPRRDLVTFGAPIKVLNCEVQASDAGGSGLEIVHVWLKNGLEIRAVSEETTASSSIETEESVEAGKSQRARRNNKYAQTPTGQLIIRDVDYSDQANYSCVAETAIGSVERSGTLLVRGPPDACGAVSADGLTQSSARLQWTDGADHFGRIVANTIEARTNHNSSWQVVAANISASPLLSSSRAQSQAGQFQRKSFLLDQVLMPFSLYEFRVSASNEFGQGPASEPSRKYRTDMAAPRLPVKNVRGGGGKAGTLLIRWDALEPSSWGAPEIWYQLYYRLNGTFEWTKRELSQANGQTDAHTINVGQDSYFRLYDVMVQPVNQVGAGPLSQPAHIRSAQQMPWVQPSNVHGQAHNSTALNVSWTPPAFVSSASYQPGGDTGEQQEDAATKLIGYRIRYWPSGKDQQTHSLAKLKRGLEPWGLVVGLQPDTEYHVSVMAYNEAGSGPESESFRLRTFKSAPQRAPTSVSAEFLTSTSVRVTWRGVAGMSTNEEPILGYKVRYWRHDEPISSARDLVRPLDGRELAANLDDLLPAETYKLRILAYSAGGDGKMSSPELIIKVQPPAA